MGTTCSKKKSVAVENTSIKIDHIQVEEIVGPTGNSPQNTLEDILQLPNAISCDDITVGESEPITRYDERKNSTGASTLIFPSYSGYRSFDGFGKGITRRTSGSHWAPTARVTPIQATPTIATPELVRNAAVELFERRGSPRVTRYSAMLTPNLPRRYDHHTEAKESSIEDDDFFGSDLESLDRELPIVLKNDDLASTRSIYSHAQIQPLTTLEEKNPNSPKQRRANAVNTDQREIYIEVCDACVGTDNDDCSRTKERRIQATTTSNMQTSSLAVGTDERRLVKKEDKMTSSTASQSGNMKATLTSQSMGTEDVYVMMVDMCVGTESDNFHRAPVTRGNQSTQVERKRKKVTSSTGVGTEGLPRIRTPDVPRQMKTPKIITQPSDDDRMMPPPSPIQRSASNLRPEPPDPIFATLKNAFFRFARYGEVNGEGREMNNKNWAKLCRDCDFIDNRNVLVGDIDVIFSRHKPKGYRLIDFEMFTNCLNEIADRIVGSQVKDVHLRRKVIYNRVIGKAPEYVGITGMSKTGNVDRMTDHTLYPVSHKMRFDDEGKGLGIDDKFEITDTQMGYVNGYTGRNQYDVKMMHNSPRSRTSSFGSATKRPISSSSVHRNITPVI